MRCYTVHTWHYIKQSVTLCILFFLGFFVYDVCKLYISHTHTHTHTHTNKQAGGCHERGKHKMSAVNMAIVLGPNLVWSQREVASLSSMGNINTLVVILIDNYKEIFTK